jgi:hypothetical protein
MGKGNVWGLAANEGWMNLYLFEVLLYDDGITQFFPKTMVS